MASPDPLPQQAHIEVDDDDEDSAFGDNASSTTSLISEVTRYQMENGRRYHGYKAGQYVFPNDDEELDRMDLENHLFNLILSGKLHLAPLENPQNILDIGTGTGIWAIDMADAYPSARVIGTDLSPTQPSNVPPNCEFQIDDYEQEWTFQENLFDFIHSRLLLGSVISYPSFIRKAFRHTKPGGYFEMQDIDAHFSCDDDSLPKDCANVKWVDLFYEAIEKFGKQMPGLDLYKGWFEDAGFVDVSVTLMKRPSNTWPKEPRMKEIGRFTCANMLEGLNAFTVGPFTRALGWKKEEVDVFVAKCKTEWRDKSIHAYQTVIVVYGKKPLQA